LTVGTCVSLLVTDNDLDDLAVLAKVFVAS